MDCYEMGLVSEMNNKDERRERSRGANGEADEDVEVNVWMNGWIISMTRGRRERNRDAKDKEETDEELKMKIDGWMDGRIDR
jgi:hypothetical protein